MLFRVGIERPSLRIEAHLGIGTQIYRAVEAGLQILDIQSELVVIRPPRRLIQVTVEAPNVILLLRQSAVEQFPSANYLHTLARSP